MTITYKEVGIYDWVDYVGKEYNLRVGENQGTVRILSKQIGSKA